MRSEHKIAFKEWAIVCRALAAGRQTLILRKGGIREKQGKFAVEHPEFFLFPTLFHQQNNSVLPDARVELDLQPKESVTLSLYAVVEQVERLTDWEKVRALAPFHIWSEATLQDRFGWGKENAITLMVARFYRLPSPVTLPLCASYGGCTSWVVLERPLSTVGAKPILSAPEFEERQKAIHNLLQ